MSSRLHFGWSTPPKLFLQSWDDGEFPHWDAQQRRMVRWSLHPYIEQAIGGVDVRTRPWCNSNCQTSKREAKYGWLWSQILVWDLEGPCLSGWRRRLYLQYHLQDCDQETHWEARSARSSTRRVRPGGVWSTGQWNQKYQCKCWHWERKICKTAK